LAEDCLEIFWAPSRVFARRRGRSFWPPLLVFGGVMAIILFATRGLMQPVMDAQFAQGIAAAQKANPQLTAEQIQASRGMMEKLGIVFAVIGSFVLPLLLGIVVWIAGKLAGAKQELGDAMTVGALASFPKILGAVVAALLAMLLPESAITGLYSVTLGLGHFLDPAKGPLLPALLGRLELFTLWTTVLIALGLRATGRLSTGAAAIAAAVVWVIGALPGLFGALRAM
jgi:hypothetical protein